jgi:hypothetical protein
MLIDGAISGDRNVIRKETEKVLRYKNLQQKVIIGATGTFSESLKKYVSDILGE